MSKSIKDMPARLLAENLVDFMLFKCPDGAGCISFDPDLDVESFYFSKLVGMLGTKDNIETVYQGATKALLDARKHAISIMITDLGNDSEENNGVSVHTVRSYVFTADGNIRPFLSKEMEDFAASIPSIPGIQFQYKRAWDWSYDRNLEPLSILFSF